MVTLFQQYESGGNSSAAIKRRLVECNLRLVVSIAKMYKNHDIPIEDLIQEGNIGLMRAVDRFKWERGVHFSTYATFWIRQAIGQHVLKCKRMIRLPAHAATVQRKMLQASEKFREEMGHEPSQEELIDLTGASATVIKATIHSGRNVLSLQQPANINDSESQQGLLEDKIEDTRPEASPFENVAQKEMLEIARKVLMNLSPKEIAIIRLRYGLVETNTEAYPITESELQSVKDGNGLR